MLHTRNNETYLGTNTDKDLVTKAGIYGEKTLLSCVSGTGKKSGDILWVKEELQNCRSVGRTWRKWRKGPKGSRL